MPKPTPDSAPLSSPEAVNPKVADDLAAMVEEAHRNRDAVRRAFLEVRFLTAFCTAAREMDGPILGYDAGFVGTFVDKEAYR